MNYFVFFTNNFAFKGEFGYGEKNKACQVQDEDVPKFKMSVFDENDPVQMQEKLLVSFGLCAGFRGNKEHAYLKVHDVVNGFFPSDHPTFPDLEWWGLKSIDSDKVTTLGMNCDYVPDCTVLGRFPVLPDLPDADFGGTIKRYVENHLPRSETCNRFHRRISPDGKRFLPNCPVGHNKIREVFKSAFKRLGVSNWGEMHSHALRGLFGDRLASDKNVTIKEGMAAMRHKSVAAFTTYQRDNTKQGEGSRLNAVLQLPEDFSSKRARETEEVADCWMNDGNVVDMMNTKMPAASNVTPASSSKRSMNSDSTISTKPLFANFDGNKDVDLEYWNMMSFKSKKRLSLKHGYPTIREFEEEMSLDHNNLDVIPSVMSTQSQLKGLYDDLYTASDINSYIPMFGQYPKKPSPRQSIVLEARRKIRRLEHFERMQSYPYKSPWDEEKTLYNDYLEHSGMRNQNVRR